MGAESTAPRPEPSGAARGTERVFRVATGQRVGDVAMMMLLFPLFFLAIGLLMAIPTSALIYGLDLGPSDVARARSLLGTCAMAALPPSLLVLRHARCWSIALLPEHLRLGSGWFARLVPYDQVRFIRAGDHGLADVSRRRAARLVGPCPCPLSIELSGTWPKRCRIWLTAQEADEALRAIHQRSATAAALDIDGKERLPRDPQHRRAGIKRLARFHLAVGVPLVAIGLLLLGMVATLLLQGEIDADMLEVTAGGIGALGGGLVALRRARRRR